MLFSFQSGATAAINEALIAIPGSQHTTYSGNVLSNELTALQTTGGVVMATGQRFLLEVYSTNAISTSEKGFNLVWKQTPCTTSGTV